MPTRCCFESSEGWPDEREATALDPIWSEEAAWLRPDSGRKRGSRLPLHPTIATFPLLCYAVEEF